MSQAMPQVRGYSRPVLAFLSIAILIFPFRPDGKCSIDCCHVHPSAGRRDYAAQRLIKSSRWICLRRGLACNGDVTPG